MREPTTLSGAPQASRHRVLQTALVSVAAIGSVLAASSCCLPILPFVVAAGFAGGSTFLYTARPYLLIASIIFVGYGFYQGWRAKRCQRRPSRIGSILLWFSALFVLVSVFFPQLMANAVASLLSR